MKSHYKSSKAKYIHIITYELSAFVIWNMLPFSCFMITVRQIIKARITIATTVQLPILPPFIFYFFVECIYDIGRYVDVKAVDMINPTRVKLHILITPAVPVSPRIIWIIIKKRIGCSRYACSL